MSMADSWKKHQGDSDHGRVPNLAIDCEHEESSPSRGVDVLLVRSAGRLGVGLRRASGYYRCFETSPERVWFFR